MTLMIDNDLLVTSLQMCKHVYQMQRIQNLTVSKFQMNHIYIHQGQNMKHDCRLKEKVNICLSNVIYCISPYTSIRGLQVFSSLIHIYFIKTKKCIYVQCPQLYNMEFRRTAHTIYKDPLKVNKIFNGWTHGNILGTNRIMTNSETFSKVN